MGIDEFSGGSGKEPETTIRQMGGVTKISVKRGGADTLPPLSMDGECRNTLLKKILQKSTVVSTNPYNTSAEFLIDLHEFIELETSLQEKGELKQEWESDLYKMLGNGTIQHNISVDDDRMSHACLLIYQEVLSAGNLPEDQFQIFVADIVNELKQSITHDVSRQEGFRQATADTGSPSTKDKQKPSAGPSEDQGTDNDDDDTHDINNRELNPKKPAPPTLGVTRDFPSPGAE